MKVLIIAPYIYIPGKKGFTKNNSGLGVSIESSSFEIGKKCSVTLVVNRFVKKYQTKSYCIEKHSFFQFLFSIKIKYIPTAFKWLFARKTKLKDKIHYFFQILNQGYIENVIKKIKPSIVHIHTICPNSPLIVNYCEKHAINYVLTLHGIISNPSISCSPLLKKMEGDLTSLISNSNYGVITCVSSGTKNELVKRYSINCEKIFVTLNGVKDDFAEGVINKRREDFGIPDDDFVIISCGNVSYNKNQFQLLESICLLPLELQKKITVLLAGKMIDERIIDNLEKYKHFNLRILGFIDRRELSKYYKMSNLNSLLSISEGFGMSIAEGYICGIPSIFYSDIDSAADLSINGCCVLIKKREESYVAQALVEAINKKWNNDFIKEQGKKFLLTNTASSYIEAYTSIIKRKEE